MKEALAICFDITVLLSQVIIKVTWYSSLVLAGAILLIIFVLLGKPKKLNGTV